MNESPSRSRISPFALLTVFVILILSFLAIVAGMYIYQIGGLQDLGWVFLLLGFLGVTISAYVLIQTRRRLMKLRIVIPPVITTIECGKCGFKNVREFQRGDYIFKEGDPCQKCNDKMLITAIYREVKEKEKQRFSF